MMIFERKTVSNSLHWEGRGLHSGVPCQVTLHPGEAGIRFLHAGHEVEAIPENVTSTARCTCLAHVATIEHLMSALAAAGITDGVVECTGPELPGLDGSAEMYTQILHSAEVASLGNRELPTLFTRVYEKGADHSVAIGKGEGWWRYTFITEPRWPSIQDFESHLTPESYATDIAPARTFCFEEELDAIREAGLGQGLDEQSALVLGSRGYVNAERFPDEPARHKLLDLIGDLYLSGVPPYLLNVVAERSGHTANVAAAAKLRDALRQE